jgi:hypothetical protein
LTRQKRGVIFRPERRRVLSHHETARRRSPSYPVISLREAEQRARVFHQEEKRNAAPPRVAFGYWGYHSPKSSGGPRTLAALRAYGLLEGDHEVRLTERALTILRRETPFPEKGGHLQEAALLPPVHRTVWSTYGAELPSDATLSAFLVGKLAFNPDAVPVFLRNYRETLEFAGLVSGSFHPELPSPAGPSLPSTAATTMREDRPAFPEDLTLAFPLLHSNRVTFHLLQKITPGEAEQLRALFELWLKTITVP